MSDNVEITARFEDKGLEYTGLTSIVVKGDARVAVEAMRAVVGKQGVGVPRQARVSARACNAGPGGFTIWAVGSSECAGREVTPEEAQRIGAQLLEQLGVKIRGAAP